MEVPKVASESRAGAPRARFEPIDALRIEGFKSIRDPVEVEIKPLTILAGRNSAGKSSLIQPLLLLKQTLEAPYDPGPVLLDGPCVRFTHAQQTLWADPEEAGAPQGWMVGVRSGSTWVDTRYALAGAELELIHTARESTQGAREVLGPGQSNTGSSLTDEDVEYLDGILGYGGWQPWVERERCGYVLCVGPYGGPATWIFDRLFNPEPFLHLIHLPGLRGNPERSYPITGVSQQFPGPFQTYTASVLMAWRDKQDPRLEGVRADLARLGLTGWVEPERREGTRVELKVSRWEGERSATSRGMVNIADVGSGSRR